MNPPSRGARTETIECTHPVMDIETGLCVDCGEPIDCPPILDFGTEGRGARRER